MIVAGADCRTIVLNEAAAARLTCAHRMEIVPGATHLFEEAGALDRVTALAGDWFETHLARASESLA